MKDLLSSLNAWHTTQNPPYSGTCQVAGGCGLHRDFAYATPQKYTQHTTKTTRATTRPNATTLPWTPLCILYSSFIRNTFQNTNLEKYHTISTTTPTIKHTYIPFFSGDESVLFRTTLCDLENRAQGGQTPAGHGGCVCPTLIHSRRPNKKILNSSSWTTVLQHGTTTLRNMNNDTP